jgi:restriction system protein
VDRSAADPVNRCAVQPPAIPSYDSFLWPVITAVRALGDSGSNDEIVTSVLERSELTEEQQQVLHGEGPQTEIAYRLAWARTYLKGMGLLNNSQRGVWNLTETGKTVTEEQIPELHRQYKLRIREARKTKPPAEELSAIVDDEEVDGHGQSDELHWRDALLAALMAMTSGAFERLAQRLLREAGFTSTTVTGRSGDGGIDGVGTYRMSLVSFPVFFQCKRYSGSVGPSVVRDFRGAMAGRGDNDLVHNGVVAGLECCSVSLRG